MQVCAPDAHELTPAKHAPGLPVQACPAVQATQAPLPSQTMPVPQAVPGDRLPKSRQACAPVAQLVTPVLHGVGLVEQFAFAVHATHIPVPLHTMLVPQAVPAGRSAPSPHVWAPVAHEVVPVLHGFALPAHGWPPAQAIHAPLPSHTWPMPHWVPAVRFAPSLQAVAVPLQVVVPCLHAVGLPVQL
jgi:hypothetical protein